MAQHLDQPLTDEQFDTLLDELNAHHKETLEAITTGGERPAAPRSAAPYTDDDFSKLPQDAKKTLADTLQQELALLADSKKTIAGLLLQAHEKKITQDQLDAGVQVREDKNKQALADLNEKLAEGLKASGHAHPESQDLIVSAYKTSSDLSAQAWNTAREVDAEATGNAETQWDKAGPKYDTLMQDLQNSWKIFA
ncbi:hypothetical protein GCM10009647_085140 [Streptomyces sanglieri]|uniref:Uncharacterized protein n=1 Tax=Streptomyces sanglieri TaxID=193460 RepID=A0ABW2WNP0_9ACTN|nr:hypothetical protein [Streptomyces sp. Wh19]MDV9198978.1 hypothetical protein [Streptomyces sp. Wh19]